MQTYLHHIFDLHITLAHTSLSKNDEKCQVFKKIRGAAKEFNMNFVNFSFIGSSGIVYMYILMTLYKCILLV